MIIDPDSLILHRALSHDFPDLDFELSSSLDQSESTLRTKRYQAVITDVRLTPLFDMIQSEQPAAPHIVTSQAADKGLAHKALQQGAFGCILKPVKKDEAVPTIHCALWLYEIRMTITRRKQTLARFVERRAALSRDEPDHVKQAHWIEQMDLSIKQSINSCEKTIKAIEQSLQWLARTAIGLEQQGKDRALKCLNGGSE